MDNKMSNDEWEKLRPFARELENSWNTFLSYSSRDWHEAKNVNNDNALRRKIENEIETDKFRKKWLDAKVAYDDQRMKIIGF